MTFKSLSAVPLALCLIFTPFAFSDEMPLSKTEEATHVQRATSIAAGLGKDNELRLLKSEKDELQTGHTKFVQYYKGVRVFGGEMISHTNKYGNLIQGTETLYRNINSTVVPTIAESNAIAIVDRDIKPKGNYKYPQKVELVIYPVLTLVHVRAGEDATAYEYSATSYTLAYIVSSKIELSGQIEHHKHVIDAKSGAVIKHWDDLHTVQTTVTGYSEYSGTVVINMDYGNFIQGMYTFFDGTRPTNCCGLYVGNYVSNMNYYTVGGGVSYFGTNYIWGDGSNYNPSNGTNSINGQTAAVDAAYGMQVTWDMYKYVLARSGINNLGSATGSRVHFGQGYDNAFWDDNCFCMTYGDGKQFKVLTALDIAAHEMSHGVVATSVSGGLTYSGESGGLNESNSDIMGTMAEFYARGGGYSSHATAIPSSGGNWTIGEQVTNPALRYMYRPSLDGHSPDAWSTTISTLDVHYSSGPGNRAFYFLSQGSSNTSSSNYYSSYLPAGMIGIGNDHAARIHYRAMTTYYTSSTTYSAARVAYLNAATDLYGTNSPEVNAVMNAFAAINVGQPGSSSTTPTPAPGLSVTQKLIPIIMQILLD